MELTQVQKKQIEELQIRSSKKIISGYLAIMAFTIPLVLWPFLPQRYFFSKMVMLYAFSIILLVFLAALKLNIFSKKMFKQPAVISSLFFLVYSTITLFYSINIDLSLFGEYERKETYFITVIYIFLFLIAANHYKFSNWHLILFSVSISLICIYAIFQLYGIELIELTFLAKYKISQSWHYMAFSTMGNPNFLASLLAMTLPLFVFAFIKSGNYFWTIPMSLNYFVLLATRTRGGWIGAFAGFAILIAIMAVRKFSFKNILICCGIHVILTIIYAFLFSGFFERLWSAFDTMATVVASENQEELLNSGSFRIGIWKGVWILIEKKPLTGYGIETLRQAIIKDPEVVSFLRSISPNIVNTDKAHNEFLNICVSSGIPAGIAYITTAISVIVQGFRNIKKNILLLPLTCSVCAYFIQGMFNISNNGIAFLFYILMGVIISLSLKGKDNNFTDEKIGE
ncbi:MAG TPA: O-antigen ligase family protein [Clostridia bacterium]|nr:MAG: O-Antigen ligase [Firmicutes bacterium ADurb.Bin146]HOD93209.1 O-antigen ligase family protein [Clostridia bacterium]HQM38938.1 O-antigen ligase family protein [Clostridia bacterium]